MGAQIAPIDADARVENAAPHGRAWKSTPHASDTAALSKEGSTSAKTCLAQAVLLLLAFATIQATGDHLRDGRAGQGLHRLQDGGVKAARTRREFLALPISSAMRACSASSPGWPDGHDGSPPASVLGELVGPASIINTDSAVRPP